MASELKLCPFCAGSNLETYYADIEGWIAHIKCVDCDDMIGPMSEFKYETKEEAYEDASQRWNHRPTPVAPLSPDATGKCGELVTIKVLPDQTELVTRSQAVELLAAERARFVEASQRATNEESFKDTMRNGLRRWKERAEKAEADNAALTARVKELSALIDGENCADPDKIDALFRRAETAETQLAARNKALTDIQCIDWDGLSVSDVFDEINEIVERAALEVKP